MKEVLERIEALSPQQRAVLRARTERLVAAAEAIPRLASTEAEFRLTSRQLRLWEIHQAAPDIPVNTVSQLVTIRGKLDVGALNAGLQLLTDRHEALRTLTITRDGAPLQRVLATAKVQFEFKELAAGDSPEQWGVDDAARAFDWDERPPFRFTLLRSSDELHHLVFTAHNLNFDAWSFTVFFEELTEAYRALQLGRTPQLPPIAVGFRDYAAWLQRWRETGAYRAKLSSARDRLRDIGQKGIPIQGTRGARSWKGERISFRLPADVRQTVIRQARAQGTTPFTLLAAVVQTWVHEASGDRDVTIGTLNANRMKSEVSRTMGFFLNTVPLRMSFAEGQSFSETLSLAKTTVPAALAQADIPFEELVQETGAALGGRHPIFDVLFVFENTPPKEPQLGNARLSFQDLDKKTARFDLSLSVYDEEAGYSGWLEFDAALYSRSFAENLAADFVSVCRRLFGN